MNPKQLQEMMAKAQDMQRELQQKMAETIVEATAGGGSVSVRMNGQKQVLGVKIEPDVVQSGDVEMLQDMITAAVNEAGRKVDEAMQSGLGGMLGGMGLPPGLF
jgi:DNA-binding YbaB/EbfC family protein